MFGVSTYCLSDKPLEVALEFLAPLTDIVEVMDDGLHYLETAERLLSYNFEYFMHAPARSVNISSQLEPIRVASVEVIGHSFEIAGEVNASVIIHPGYYAWKQEYERAARQLKKSLAELRALADECSITFFVENMPNWEHFFLKCPDELPLIGETGLALDVGHAYLNACLDKYLELPFSHAHIHDNLGIDDSHSAIGLGEINFKPVMEAVRKNNVVPVIEVDSPEGVVTSIEALKNL